MAVAVASLRKIKTGTPETAKGTCSFPSIPCVLPLGFLSALVSWEQQHIFNLGEDVPSHRSSSIQFSVFPALTDQLHGYQLPLIWHPLLKVWVTAPANPSSELKDARPRWAAPLFRECGMLEPALPRARRIELYDKLSDSVTQGNAKLLWSVLIEQMGDESHGFRAGELISWMLLVEHL